MKYDNRAISNRRSLCVLLLSLSAVISLYGCTPNNSSNKDASGSSNSRSNNADNAADAEDPRARSVFNSISRIVIKEDRAGNVTSIDFRNCDPDYVTHLDHLQGLPFLRSITLSGANITDDVIAKIAPLKGIAAIGLIDCQVTDDGFAHFQTWTKLRELNIVQTPVTGKALASFRGAADMTKIKFSDTKITDQDSSALQNFPNLTHIELSKTAIGDATLEVLGHLQKLEDVNVWLTHVSSDGISKLTGLGLKRLNLDDNRLIDDRAVPSIAQMSSLEFLHLGKTSVTDEGLKLLESLSNLKELRINNTAVSDAAVNELRAKLTNLTTVVK